ncbi:MAG: tetratricopeptide repeat protein [Gammaproteobacteria bacterium]|nr:tetratricopeptide repeat protein [Gammaproteobacteria bacterium]MDH5651564.1 tetratricopeptide repeat protein [Gammaproteobacteria bacterium]
MLRQFTSIAALAGWLLIPLLSGCGSLPGTPTPDIPAQAENDYRRALASMKKGKHDLALKQFTALTKKYPQLAGAHANLGLLHLKDNRVDQAEQSLQKATQLNPNNAIAQNYLGIVYRRQGKFTEAKTAYLAALQADKDYAYAHLNLGILYDLYLFDLQNAIKHYQQYQDMTESKDKTVEKWLLDLKRRGTAENKQGGKKG